MQGLSLVIIAILLMVVLNVLTVVATVAVKALRSYEKRRVQKLRDRLEPALYDHLVTGEVAPILQQQNGRDQETLKSMIVELLTALRGTEYRRIVEFAEKLGLVEEDFARLRSRRRWCRARAAENLGYYGGPGATNHIGALLDEEDETVRAVAARALSRIGSQEAADFLSDRLISSSELTRLRMAENLERIGSLAVEPLLELIESEEDEKRRAQVLAARVIGNIRVYEARPTLGRAIRRRWNTDLRAQATLALGQIGDPDDVPVILEAAGDDFWPVRVQAANALGMIGETSAIPTLEKLAVDQEWWVRLNASRSLVNMGSAGEQALARILEGPDRFARDRVAAVLQERGIVRRLVEELAEGNGRSEDARNVIQALVRNGATRYLNHLARTLPEKSERQTLRKVMAEAEAEPNDA